MEHLVEAATALTRLNPNNSMGTEPSTPPEVKTTLQPGNADSKAAVISHASASTLNHAPPTPVVSPPRMSISAAGNKKEIFPQKLMAVLGDESLSDIIAWLPHGRSWVVLRPDVFTEQIMPKYFPPMDARSSSKYPSFTRKLNRWGFKQMTRGADTGAFHHPLFQREQPHLCLDMVCQRSRDRKSSSQGKKAGEKGRGPLKKRPSQSRGKSATLTKEALDSMAAATQTADGVTKDRNSALYSVVSVEDSSSESGRSNSPSSSQQPKQTVTADAAVVQSALQQRDEMERLRVAKAMLYNAYMNVLQTKASPPAPVAAAAQV